MLPIYHITSSNAWETAVAAGSYTTPSLESDGFIHCSTRGQILLPANERFRGQQGLVLLQIDPQRVKARIIFEDCYDTGQQFPHIYGALDIAAVQQVIPFPPNNDGTFSLPPEIS